MCTSTGRSRQGVRGSGAPVRITQAQADRRLQGLMSRRTPARGNTFSDAEMRAMARQAGFNTRRFR